jgi:hypothetical protein
MPTKPAPLASGIGRPPKHAGRLLSRVVRKNQLDRRTGVSRLLERVANDLADDRGGWANVSAAEEIAIRRAAFLTVLCGSIEAWCLGQGDVIHNGELLGPLKKGLATHQANLIRTLTALGLRPERTKVPSLEEYLANRNGNAAHRDGNGARSDDHGPGQATAPPTGRHGSSSASAAPGHPTAMQSEPHTAAPQRSPSASNGDAAA